MKWLAHAGLWNSSSFYTLLVYHVSISALVFPPFISFLCLSVLSSCVLQSFLFGLAAFVTFISFLAKEGVYNLIWFYGCNVLNVVHFGNAGVHWQDCTKSISDFVEERLMIIGFDGNM
jgi:hypothetical protein